MKEIYILDSLNKVGTEIQLLGSVHNIRVHKSVVFIDLRDMTGIIQVVGGADLSILTPEDVVSIKGIVKKRPEKLINPKIKTGEIEIEAKEVEILSKSQKLPFEINTENLDLTLPTLLNYRALTLRHPKIKAIFKVQETVIDSFREGLKKKGFTEFQSPVIIPEAAEGGAAVFEVAYFKHKAYLAQSPQFYKQILVPVFEKVFTVNKTLRAEPSVTTRHLTEVTTLDAEFGFIDSFGEVMDMAEYTIKYILFQVERKNKDILEMYNTVIPRLSAKIPQLKFVEALEIIKKRTGKNDRAKMDLDPEDEREICKWAQEEKDSDLIFITHFPIVKRPFYTHEDPKDPGFTLSFDLLGHGIEWLTGGQRINDLNLLLENAKSRNINIEKSELYLQAFRYGMPPEGGFSFGSERIVMSILNLDNIREASIFPRDMERVDIHLPSVKEDEKK